MSSGRWVAARLVAAATFAAVASGCATTWVVSQVAAGRPPFDEDSQEESVPLPGVEERLTIVLHLSGRPVPPPAAVSPAPASPPAPVKGPLELACSVEQEGRERVYRASTRYGTTWKLWTAAAFLAEGALAAGLLLTGQDSPLQTAGGAVLAADAFGSGLLFLAPQRDVYERSEREVVTPVREDCPEGLMLEVDGRDVPVNALGGVGDLGQALFERHMLSSAAAMRVRIGDHSADVELSPADRCAWATRQTHEAAPRLCEGVERWSGRASVRVLLRVPAGTSLARGERPLG